VGLRFFESQATLDDFIASIEVEADDFVGHGIVPQVSPIAYKRLSLAGWSQSGKWSRNFFQSFAAFFEGFVAGLGFTILVYLVLVVHDAPKKAIGVISVVNHLLLNDDLQVLIHTISSMLGTKKIYGGGKKRGPGGPSGVSP
jgi:hypothetical protein